MHYYQLGQIIEEQVKAKKYLSEYQKKAAWRTFYIFESLGNSQIAQTKRITVKDLTRLKKEEFLKAREESKQIFLEIKK